MTTKKATKVPKGTKRSKKVEIVEQPFDAGTDDGLEKLTKEDNVILPAEEPTQVQQQPAPRSLQAIVSEEPQKPLTWRERLKRLFFAWA